MSSYGKRRPRRAHDVILSGKMFQRRPGVKNSNGSMWVSMPADWAGAFLDQNDPWFLFSGLPGGEVGFEVRPDPPPEEGL